MMKHDGTEGRGISYVDYVVRNALNWIFRDQRVDDRGIDGQIEVCADGHALGRLIAAQIKAGPSYFDEPTGEGWIFRDSLEHLEYFLKHSLPVIVILCDLDRPAAYWEKVTVETIEKTRKGWKLHIPMSNTLDKSARSKLRALAHPTPQVLSTLRVLAASVNQASRPVYSQPRDEPGLLAPHVIVPFFLRALVSASQSVYFVMPYISSEIVWALKAVSMSVRVQGVVDTDDPQVIEEIRLAERETPNLTIRHFRSARARGRLHAKLIVVDGALVITGSANMTPAGLRRREEMMFATSDEPVIREQLDTFWDIWRMTSPLT